MTRRTRRFNPDRDVKEWTGAYRPYDIIKEAFVALVAVGVLVLLLTVVFSSPDEPAVTLKSWSTTNPVDFAQTAVTELDGTSAVATYGPPYNATPDVTQHIGFFEPAQWVGVHQPIDTAQDFVIGPTVPAFHPPLVEVYRLIWRQHTGRRTSVHSLKGETLRGTPGKLPTGWSDQR